MKITINGSSVLVVRESNDPKYYGKGWAKTHRLFHAIKIELRNAGLDVIKRRLSSDGHLMGNDETPYIRDRKWRYAIIDEQWQLRDAAEDYNRDGRVMLTYRSFTEE